MEKPMAAINDVLTQHRIVSHGMAASSPDTCSCGAKLTPEPGDSIIEVRRHEAYVEHMNGDLAAAAQQAQAELLNNLAQYAVDYVGTDGEKLIDLVEQQMFDDTASWLRHRATLVGQELING